MTARSTVQAVGLLVGTMAIGVPWMPDARAEAPQPAKCAGTLAPLEAAQPVLPAALHNEFAGRVTVVFSVAEDGTVIAPAIDSAIWEPIGHAGRQPRGYESAVVSAVARWKYPARREPCRHEAVLRIDWHD